MKVELLLRDTPPSLPLLSAFADNTGKDLTADWDLHQTVSAPDSWATNKSRVLIAGKKIKSTSWETPAVYLDTDRMLVFVRCDCWHRGTGMANWLNSSIYKRGARVRLVNCRFFELPSREAAFPELTKKAPGKAVKLVYFNHFEMENCEVYGSSGVQVDRAEDPEGIATVRVRCNNFWDNRLLSAAVLPAGTPYPDYENDGEGEKVVWRKYEQEQPSHYNAAAMAIFDFVKRGAAYSENTPKEMMATNSMQGQRVGWRKWKSNRTYNGKLYTYRLELTENEFAPQIVHTVHETDDPITLVDLDFAFHQWLVKVQLVGNRIGGVEGK